MKKTIIFVALAASAVIFSYCKKNEYNQTPNQTTEPVEAWFSSIITDITKASGTTWAPNDAIGIYMINSGLPLISANIAEGADNRKYVTTTGSGAFSPDPGQTIFYPSDGSQKVDFVAYYPYQPGINSTVKTIYAVNVANQTSQEAIDLMYADKVESKDKNSVVIPLNFKHALSKIIFNISPGTGLSVADLAGITVTIKGMNTKADCYLSNGVLSPVSSKLDIVAKSSADGTKAEAIVLPETVYSMSVQFKLNSTRNNLLTSEIISEKTFEHGKVYNFNVTLSPTGISMPSTITDWALGVGETLTAN